MDFGWFLVKPWFFQPLQPYGPLKSKTRGAKLYLKNPSYTFAYGKKKKINFPSGFKIHKKNNIESHLKMFLPIKKQSIIFE
jgi:hypothetical protein